MASSLFHNIRRLVTSPAVLSSSVMGGMILASILTTGCSKKDAPEPAATAAKVDEAPAEAVILDPHGTETIDEFRQRFSDAFTTKDQNKYLQLHCLEKLPATLRASLTGAVASGSLNVFSFEHTKVEIEPLTDKEKERIQPADWNILPTHWVIVTGQTPKQFKHWELGQFEGRYYLANRIR